ncbi:MAG: tRNA (adenosine(37)-N6)-threonylcarbamoyltransferase complex transferase subunit TsaD, partial [Alphaproteobacteria bacterium]|nr:tRNA (adenosine(37)-N6)-threonylcarbamoyltransferase complex transferase subunit TsaD [Alphaproteobacteria bacterium]
MKILGIETSCDETAAAIVTADKEILANIVLSQTEEHLPYGGVVPEIAARAHAHHLDDIIRSCLSKADCSLNKMDAIAVTAGPGLIGGVIVGVMTAKAIAASLKKPFIAVNHLEGHALTVRLTDNVTFPYLMLLVSGGHCQLLAVEAVGKYHKLGGTLDDALGEAFDKTAKMLGLGYPGGPEIERLAKIGNADAHKFTQPLQGRANSDFSFSGLKTAIRQKIIAMQAEGAITQQDKADICASFQATVAAILRDRLRYGIQQFCSRYPDAKQFVVAGGVAANLYLREALNNIVDEYGMALVVPPPKLCTDNA